MGNGSERQVERFLQEYHLRVERFTTEEMRNRRTPDFKVHEDHDLRFYCEVKEITRRDVEGIENDSTFNKITRHIGSAAAQLRSVNESHSKPNVMVIVCNDPMVDVEDLRSSLSGYFHADDGSRHQIYGHVSARVRDDLGTVDLFIWLRGSYPGRLGINLFTGEPVDDPPGPWFTLVTDGQHCESMKTIFHLSAPC